MARWSDFCAGAPEIAEAGRALLYQHGLGLAYLATVRSDGGPRVHPVCPTIVHDRLWVSVGPSPKQRDLIRDRRYALHTFPKVEADDEFYVEGSATAVDDEEVRAAAMASLHEDGVSTSGDEVVFELSIDRALLATYGPRPSWPPEYRRWAAS